MSDRQHFVTAPTPPGAIFRRATVTQASPLRVRLDGDTTALPITPDSTVAGLAVSDRVRVMVDGTRLEVTGRFGGTALLSGRNRIINGNFRTNQRGYVSAASLASGVYGFDRWKSSAAGTTLTFTSAPQGQTVTINTSHSIQQVIEQANAPAGSFVLSWAGTATGRVYNSGGTAPSYAASPVTFAADGTANVVVEFAGGTLGNVQVEAGTVPTPFEQASVAAELAECQRYYQRISGTLSNVALVFGYQAGTSTVLAGVQLAVTMRANPSVSQSGVEWSDQATFGAAMTGLTITGNDKTSISLSASIAASGAAYRPGVIRANSGASGYLAFDAEL